MKKLRQDGYFTEGELFHILNKITYKNILIYDFMVNICFQI